MADAHGSGPCVRKDVRVQLPPRPHWILSDPSGFVALSIWPISPGAAGRPVTEHMLRAPAGRPRRPSGRRAHLAPSVATLQSRYEPPRAARSMRSAAEARTPLSTAGPSADARTRTWRRSPADGRAGRVVGQHQQVGRPGRVPLPVVAGVRGQRPVLGRRACCRASAAPLIRRCTASSRGSPRPSSRAPASTVTPSRAARCSGRGRPGRSPRPTAGAAPARCRPGRPGPAPRGAARRSSSQPSRNSSGSSRPYSRRTEAGRRKSAAATTSAARPRVRSAVATRSASATGRVGGAPSTASRTRPARLATSSATSRPARPG